MMTWLAPFKLRRPFSRKIRIGTDRVLTPDGRAAFFQAFAPLVGRSALATALAALAKAYGGEAAEAGRLTGLAAGKRFTGEFDYLYRRADLRKFAMACLRGHCAGGGALSRPLSEALLGLARATDPEARKIDRPAAPAGASRAPLEFDYVSRRPGNLKIHIYIRTYFYHAQSRLHDMGPRFQSAFDGDGVECKIIDPDSPDGAPGRCDLALVDDIYIHRKDPEKKRGFLEAIRNSAGKMAMLEMDPWVPGLRQRIEANRDLYDFVWSMAPALAIDDDKSLHGLPVTLIPFPAGAPGIFAPLAIDGRRHGLVPIKFCGAVEDYNFHRYFWVLAAASFANPPAFDITSHDEDGLSALASLALYLERLAASHACLNFLMRGDGSRTIVGRSFDSLCLRQLLVQERCDDMHAYLRPGTDYLEFDNISQLQEICARLPGQPAAFEAIRRQGAATFQARYADAAVLRHLAAWL